MRALIVPVSAYDDAFKAMFTSRRKDLAAVAVDLLGETDGTPFVRVKRLEEISAGGEFEAANIVTVEIQQIESKHDGRAGVEFSASSADLFMDV
jgi:hypothetical protein